MTKKVFLGGTCNGSLWREQMMPMLEIDYFNPVVEDWTPECQTLELQERASCWFCFYVITPKMTGVYSIAEVTDDSNKRPKRTVLVILPEDNGETFSAAQWKSLQAVSKLVTTNGGAAFDTLQAAADFINSH